ncbi:ABC transporter ATP-binding protein/permease [Fictibacillus nanhaiensis]|uniref:ABC transporter ATP-binding protein n=1 Tax=Fictibacillus nanhaiensis TaxID=742169 RepID=UPI00203B07E2|nr:ABC transporter ATP-binding protein [Fictibacillus nanhaiensis]MCM3730234.1 ABC transporter ATP-binding protein/permease [Fictibacillus nanhaiensis]
MSQIAAKQKNRDGRRVLAFLKPHKNWVFADAFVIAVSQVFSALIPTLALGWLVDTILPGESNKLLWGLMWLLIFAAVADLILMVIDEYFCHQVAKTVTNWQKLRLFKHLQILPFSFYQNNQSGEMMARVSDDPDTLHNFLAWEGSTFMASVQGVILYSIVLLWIHPYLMITSVVLGVIFYLTSNAVGQRTRQSSANARKEASRYLERLRESVTGIHLSRVLGVSEGEVKSVAEIRKSFIKESRNELKARMQSIVIIGSYNGLGLAVVYGLSAYLIWNNRLTTGEMLTAAGLVAIAANEMQRMLRNWLSVRRTGPALDRSEILLSEKISSAETEKGIILPALDGSIELSEVAFGYPEKDEQVLKGLSFSVQPGEAVALVGPSGSGKSTIIDLLLRLYDPDSGSIYIDGIDISSIDAGWLRSQIAIVSQDVQLRNGSLADNLRIAKPEATDEELLSAIHDSGLGEFIQSLPDGLNTLVGERGSLLSGGQKQRLSLARALVKDAAILVLDEASSALDPITEVQVNEAINKRKSKQTVFIISHRLSTVLAANHIIVIENGKMIEQGRHETLLESENGVYSRLFKREAEIGTQAFSN